MSTPLRIAVADDEPDIREFFERYLPRLGYEVACAVGSGQELVERAKGAVTRRVGVPEDEAYRRLRKYASDRNQKLAEAARLILDAEEIFRALDRS